MFSLIKRSRFINQSFKTIFSVEKNALNKYCSSHVPTAIRRTKGKTKSSGVSYLNTLRLISQAPIQNEICHPCLACTLHGFEAIACNRW